jgi:hypothetical protein
MFQKSKLYLGKSLVVTIIMISHPTINLSEVQNLTMKINNTFRGGILDVVIMLDSFSRGVKD